MQIVLSPVHTLSCDAWSRIHLEEVNLGDRRRTRRLVEFVAKLAQFPGASIPQLSSSWSETKAYYRLFSREEATPDAVQEPSCCMVMKQAAEPGTTTLFLEDTTTLSWAGNMPVEGLGPVGSGAKGLQGYHLHTSLAVRWPEASAGTEEEKRPPVVVLGIADQQELVRVKRPRGSKKRESGYSRLKRRRETERWMNASEALGRCPAGARWVRVADREADLYEYLVSCVERDHDVLVRVAQNRTVLDVDGDKAGYLLTRMRSLPASGGESVLTLRGRNGAPARQARLRVAWSRLTIKRPWRFGAKSSLPESLEVTAIRVFEKGRKKGLEWILLTSLEVSTSADAWEMARMYACRWMVEDFHKALKTGLGAENLQLEKASRLMTVIAVMSLVAVRLVDLRERIRINAEAPASESGLDAFELKILEAATQRKLLTVRDVGLAIGRLGGHLNRRADGMPGTLTLWRGLVRLQALVEGARLVLSLDRYG